jgi:uncharacterized membrane protein required for colicin V production
VNYFDLAVLVIAALTAISGFRSGLLQSIFKTVGYIAGGVLGLAISLEVVKNWQSNFAKLGVALLLIFLLAGIGEFLLGKIGLGIHKKILFGPFKFADSLLGAALSMIRTIVVIYLVAILLIASPWSWADKNIQSSNFYTTIDKKLPKIITDYKAQVEDIFKKIN